MYPHNPTHCPHCQAVVPRQPSRWRRDAVVVLAWLVAITAVFGSALLGPINIGILPIFIPATICMVSGAHIWAYPDVICDACGKLIILEGDLLEAEGPEPVPATALPSRSIAA